MSQLKQFYEEEVAPKLTETFGYKNAMQVPMLKKIVLNMGLGEAIQNIKLLDSAVEELKVISGQKPVITRAKRSIATFKLREGMPIEVVQEFLGHSDISTTRSIYAPVLGVHIIGARAQLRQQVLDGERIGVPCLVVVPRHDRRDHVVR